MFQEFEYYKYTNTASKVLNSNKQKSGLPKETRFFYYLTNSNHAKLGFNHFSAVLISQSLR